MTHQMFVGCCHVEGCPCLGMDGSGPYCEPALHTAEHGGIRERPAPRTDLERLERLKGHSLTENEKKRILRLHGEGVGSRSICRQLGINRNLVRAVIHEVHGPGPATHERTRPRDEDRERALAAGITAEEFRAERAEGGRARTIESLNAWIAERTAIA